MAVQALPGLRNFDTNLSSIQIIGDQTQEANTSQTSTHTVINNPFPFIDPDVWEWFIQRGLYEPVRALGEVTDLVAGSFGIQEDDISIHFSYDGAQRYAIVVRLPVQEEGSDRFEVMGEIENAFYRRLDAKLDRSQGSAWLRGEVSLAFLPP